MASYIREHLGPNEHITYETDISALIYVPYVLGGFLVFLVFLLPILQETKFSFNSFLFLCAGIGAASLFLLVPWLERISNEFAVTNKRLVMKTGLIRRNVFEMRLAKIESIDLAQSIMGRIFGYGNLTVQGTGEGTKTFSMIPEPAKFRQAIMDAIDGASQKM